MSAVWCIKAGRDGEADSFFLNENCVAIGWCDLGNLTEIANEKSKLKSKIMSTYPDAKQGAIPVYAGILQKFVNEIKIGDIVVYPSKIDKHIHIGTISGDYVYNKEKSSQFPNQRPVKWQKAIPRTNFSQAALFEIGSLLALIQIRNNTEEFTDALKDVKAVEKQDNVETIKIDYDQNVRDFIAKRIIKQIKGHLFTEMIAHILRIMGYKAKVSPPGPDHGVDIVASKDSLGCVQPLIKLQCKGIETSIGESDIGYFMSVIGENEVGIFVNFGTYTKQAKDKAFHTSKIRLLDQDDVIDLILEHYDELDYEWKTAIPLKRVFVPDIEMED